MPRRHAISTTLAVLTVGLLAMIAGMLLAGTTVIDPATGHVLSVELYVDPLDPMVQGIRYRDRDLTGHTILENIPSSVDPVIDRSPGIGLEPAGGVVVIWSRFDGSDFELVLARRENGFWSNHLFLTSDSTNDTQPRFLIDSTGATHVLWWGGGPGGPVYLQTFDPLSGTPLGPRGQPLEPPQPRKRLLPNPRRHGTDFLGGADDPGIPTTSSSFMASAIPCGANPAAAPDHGVVMGCGRPAAYQLSDCQLVVGVQDPATLSWGQTTANLATVNLSTTSVREIVQSIADFQCSSQ